MAADATLLIASRRSPLLGASVIALVSGILVVVTVEGSAGSEMEISADTFFFW